MTTIVHLSDTHLGYAGQGVQRVVEDLRYPGLRLRQQEVDIMQGLAVAVDRILDRATPDLVIHSGDLFDSARPTARNINFAMTQFARLSSAGVPIVIVEGNHSYPRDRVQGHILRVLSHLPGVTVVCEEARRVIVGTITVHAFPHRALANGQLPQLAALDPHGANVLVAHAVADGLEFYRTGRYAPDLAIRHCAPWYDYVALGHYHLFGQVPGTDRAFYSGATAMVMPGDFHPCHRFGFNVVDLAPQCPVISRELLDTRPMHAYGIEHAEGLSAKEVLDFLAAQAAEVPPDDSYCQVVVACLDPLARKELSTRLVEEIFAAAAALIVNLRVREQRWDAVRSGLLEGGDPVARYGQLVEQADGDGAFKSEVLALGRQLLTDAYERVGAEDAEVEGAVGAEGGG